MRTNLVRVLAIAAVALSAVFLVILGTNCVGVFPGSLEDDARRDQYIDEDWSMVQASAGPIAAMLFYPQDQSAHTFSVYVDRPGFSFGYFFRAGGGLTSAAIAEFTVSGQGGRVYLSMNEHHAVRAVIGGGADVQVVELDGNAPFALAVPPGVGNAIFYDGQGEVVETVCHTL